MADGFDLYAETHDRKRPVACFDESPVQLIGETRQPILVRCLSARATTAMRYARICVTVVRCRTSPPIETVRCSVSGSLDALRSRIECFIGHLKERRRIATRYDKTK